MPQYMLLIYGSDEGGPAPEEMDAHMQEWGAYTQGLQDAGVWRAGQQLHGVESATTIRVREAETLITDGPFAVTKEYLGGYYLLECPDLDAALAHAARAPIVTYGAVEVRPLVEAPAATAAGNGAPA